MALNTALTDSSTKTTKKNENVEYDVIWGNVILGAVFFETFVAPIYFFGFSMFKPVGPKDASEAKGQVRP